MVVATTFPSVTATTLRNIHKELSKQRFANRFNPLSANPSKLPNKLKQFVGGCQVWC